MVELPIMRPALAAVRRPRWLPSQGFADVLCYQLSYKVYVKYSVVGSGLRCLSVLRLCARCRFLAAPTFAFAF
jgi:hypothetical protein